MIRIVFGVAGTLAIVAGTATVTAQIPLNPAATYLHTSAGDAAPATVPIELASVGVSPGMTIRLTRWGDWSNGIEEFTTLLAVFSGSSNLFSSTQLNRVSDAIDAGDDAATSCTHLGCEPTDITEDFLVDDLLIEVPPSATHIFFSPRDSFYADNEDVDSNYAVCISIADFSYTAHNPSSTYLHTSSDDASSDSAAISLSAFGIQPGMNIRLTRIGTWHNGIEAGFDGLVGVFSSSDILLSSDQLNRVVDAVDAGADFLTLPTNSNSEPTDIPEDFLVDDIIIEVPPLATHLFMTATDTAFHDNGTCDFGVSISIVGSPIPTVSEWGVTVMTLMLLTAGTIVYTKRHSLAA